VRLISQIASRNAANLRVHEQTMVCAVSWEHVFKCPIKLPRYSAH
jgi:hypothetical protein